VTKALTVEGFELQTEPRILLAAVPGSWLLKHSTPSWRIEDPELGFQRVVKEERAREIAVAVLDQGRTFPNAIVLATDSETLRARDCEVRLAGDAKFLVVDGQHRLWAQKYASHEAVYACVIHTGLTEVDMARLFLEINDNQKRVPSSLRWDLVRLVRPDDDPAGIEASELVFELATDRNSPLYQRIDLTGEQGEIDLKQGSIAPELKSLVSSKRGWFRDTSFEQHYEALIRFFAGLRSVDPDGWRSGATPLVKARVLRALIRTIPDIARKLKKPPDEVLVESYRHLFGRIDRDSLSTEQIRAIQGSAGIKEIRDLVSAQMGLG
jgi:DGQHR domain-containing protein